MMNSNIQFDTETTKKQCYSSSKISNGKKPCSSSSSGRSSSFTRLAMNYLSRQWNRDATPCSLVKFLLAISAVCLILNLLGILDRIFEESYEQFQWPFGHVDPAKQISLLRRGEQMEYMPVYNNHVTFINSACASSSKKADDGLPLILILVRCSGGDAGGSSTDGGEAARRKRRQQQIRRWWSEQQEFARTNGKYAFALYFLTGTAANTSNDQQDDETTRSNDIIQYQYAISAHDKYDDDDDAKAATNEAFSYISAWTYSYDQCKNDASYLLLIRDHYSVNLGNLIRYVDDQQRSVAGNEAKPLYAGYLYENEAVTRHGFGSRYRLSLGEYPFARFPPFVDSGAILFSRESVALFYYGSQYVKPFKFGAVYVGIVAKYLNITASRNEQMVPSDGHVSWKYYLVCELMRFSSGCFDPSKLIAWPVDDSEKS